MDLEDFRGTGGHKATGLNVLRVCVAAATVGAVAFVSAFVSDPCALVFGVIGLLLSSYAMRMVGKRDPEKRATLLALCAASLVLSVFGFMFGFIGLLS